MMRALLTILLIAGLSAPNCTALSNCLQRATGTAAGCCCPTVQQMNGGCCCEKKQDATRGSSQANAEVRNLEPAVVPLSSGVPTGLVSWSAAITEAPITSSRPFPVPLFLLKGSFLI